MSIALTFFENHYDLSRYVSYYLIHRWGKKGFITFPRVSVRKWIVTNPIGIRTLLYGFLLPKPVNLRIVFLYLFSFIYFVAIITSSEFEQSSIYLFFKLVLFFTLCHTPDQWKSLFSHFFYALDKNWMLESKNKSFGHQSMSNHVFLPSEIFRLKLKKKRKWDLEVSIKRLGRVK